MSLITSIKLPVLKEVTNEEVYTLELLGEDTDLYRHLKQEFENAGLVIKTVEHLASFHNWNKYINTRKIIEERKPQHPDFKLNETFLYHGTQAEKDKLCEEGFDVNLASLGCFGRGLYFSDSVKKCEKYSRDSGTMVVARVILGAIKEYPDKKKDNALVREPEKENPDANEWRFYDSVKGRPRDHMEYVIYRSDRVLIEYIVTFSKASDEVQASSPVPQSSDAKPQAVSCDDKYDTEAKMPDKDLESSEDKKYADSDSDSDDEFEDADNVVDYTSSSDDDDDQFKDILQDDEDDEEFKDVPRDSNFVDQYNKERDSVIPYFVIPTGELSLEQKKKEYKRVTQEQDDKEVDSIMKSTDEDLERAIYLFYARKQVKEEDAKRQRGETVDDDIIEDDGSPIFPLMEPEYESEAWKKLAEDEKKSRMDKMVTDFLLITALEDLHIQIASNYVSTAKYNLDTAVVNYYKSWF